MRSLPSPMIALPWLLRVSGITMAALPLTVACSVCSCVPSKPNPSNVPAPGPPLADEPATDEVERSFRIETTDLMNENSRPRYWIVTDTQRVRLPDLPHPEASSCPGADFTVSPDRRWIFANEKLYRGANEVWLLRRDSGLRYSMTGDPTFSRAALAYYETTSGMSHPGCRAFITRIGPWPADGRNIRLTLYGRDWLDVALCYDLQTGRFSISEDQVTRY